MTQEEMKMLQGIFQGANLNNVQINMVVQSGAKVVYKEVTSAKDEKPQVTDIQIANAIEKSQAMFGHKAHGRYSFAFVVTIWA